MHPQKADAIHAFIAAQGWSEDHSQPLVPTPSVAELAGERAVVARAELEAANAALAEVEGLSVQPVPVAPIATETAAIAPEQPRRGRGRPPKALAAALAAEGLDADD